MQQTMINDLAGSWDMNDKEEQEFTKELRELWKKQQA